MSRYAVSCLCLHLMSVPIGQPVVWLLYIVLVSAEVLFNVGEHCCVSGCHSLPPKCIACGVITEHELHHSSC